MREITLNQGMKAFVSDEDYALVAPYKWSILPDPYKRYGFYAKATVRSTTTRCGYTTVLMHRLLTQAPKSHDVDHINGNGLDNQKHNLRLCTKSQNRFNARKRSTALTSQYKGVCWHKGQKKWVAQVRENGRVTCLGAFSDEREAACAYDQAAQRLYGEFAHLNFPQEVDSREHQQS